MQDGGFWVTLLYLVLTSHAHAYTHRGRFSAALTHTHLCGNISGLPSISRAPGAHLPLHTLCAARTLCLPASRLPAVVPGGALPCCSHTIPHPGKVSKLTWAVPLEQYSFACYAGGEAKISTLQISACLARATAQNLLHTPVSLPCLEHRTRGWDGLLPGGLWRRWELPHRNLLPAAQVEDRGGWETGGRRCDTSHLATGRCYGGYCLAAHCQMDTWDLCRTHTGTHLSSALVGRAHLPCYS